MNPVRGQSAFRGRRAACVLAFWVTCFGAVLWTVKAEAERRVALVVGNSAYVHAPALDNPSNDVALIAERLTGLDFEVTEMRDLSGAALDRALREFLDRTEGADVTLFYYAGHGMQFGGQNFLLGTDARLEGAADVISEAIDLDRIILRIKARTRAALLFIDACRDNPLSDRFYARHFSRELAERNRGLAPLNAAFDGAMIMFSASPGQVAFDGAQENSPFAAALAAHLGTADKEVLTLTKRVIGDVRRQTGGQQTPVVTNDLAEEIVLRPRSEADALAARHRAEAYADEENRVFAAAQAIGTARAWAHYFDAFPSGGRALEARDAEALALRKSLQALVTGASTTARETASLEEMRRASIGFHQFKRAEVMAIQSRLSQLGYLKGRVDGAFGAQSASALADFQRDRGLAGDGIIDRASMTALALRPRGGRQAGWYPVAGAKGRRLDRKSLALVEDDPRVLRMAEAFAGRRINYGFHDGRLYAVVFVGRLVHLSVVDQHAGAAGGHLATLTSKAEHDFVVRLFGHDDHYWQVDNPELGGGRDNWIVGPTFGLRQASGASGPRAGWGWVTGEASRYRNWVSSYPRNPLPSVGEFRSRGGPVVRSTSDWGWGDYFKVRDSIVVEIE